MLDTHVQKLGQELGMEDQISSPEAGHFRIPLIQNIEVEAFQSPQGHSTFRGTIGPLPQQNGEEFAARTLEANLFGRGTRGAVIGLDEDGNLLTLTMEVDYNETYKEWKERLEDFISVIDYW